MYILNTYLGVRPADKVVSRLPRKRRSIFLKKLLPLLGPFSIFSFLFLSRCGSYRENVGKRSRFLIYYINPRNMDIRQPSTSTYSSNPVTANYV